MVAFLEVLGSLGVSDRLIAGSIGCWRRFRSLKFGLLSFHEKDEKQPFKSSCASSC